LSELVQPVTLIVK